ncbi:MAG: trypsin-like peptidase domain-containing protein, partial [Finegoldia magna]|nr:trypsin-like peptidase domain-containing protein [Finegoldia magna]
MDRDPYSEYNDYIQRRKDGLNERKVENMIKEEIAKNKPKIGWLKALTIFLLIYSLVMSYFVAKNMTGITETINKNGQVESSTISIKNNSVSTENAVAKKSLDSVVGITTVGVQENMFFQGRVVEGVGSGVVVSKDGYILTNAHVVQDGKAEKIEVLLTNGKKSSAKLLWYDTTLDLAVIKTDMTGLKPVEMGDSDKVQIGDKAIAIGNPLGLDLQSTLTSGYISGKDRTITLQNGLQMDGLMQTDAAINSG